MSDMLLTLWSTLAMGLALAAFRDGTASGWYIPVLGAVLGLGFQTKGPVALLLPGLGILALLWQRRRQRWPITLRLLLLALTLVIVIGLGWFAIIYLRMGPEPLAHFFLRENLERFAASTYDVGRRAWWYYVPAYLAFGLPWSPFLAVAGWHVLWGGPEDRHSRLLLGWMGLMAVLLSLSRGKIDYYLSATAAPGLPGDWPLLRCCDPGDDSTALGACGLAAGRPRSRCGAGRYLATAQRLAPPTRALPGACPPPAGR